MVRDMKSPGHSEVLHCVSWMTDEVNPGPLSVCREEGILT
jgi:hypothetical protein